MKVEDAIYEAIYDEDKEKDLKELEEILNLFINLINKEEIKESEIGQINKSIMMTELFIRALELKPDVIPVNSTVAKKLNFIKSISSINQKLGTKKFLEQRNELKEYQEALNLLNS